MFCLQYTKALQDVVLAGCDVGLYSALVLQEFVLAGFDMRFIYAPALQDVVLAGCIRYAGFVVSG